MNQAEHGSKRTVDDVLMATVGTRGMMDFYLSVARAHDMAVLVESEPPTVETWMRGAMLMQQTGPELGRLFASAEEVRAAELKSGEDPHTLAQVLLALLVSNILNAEAEAMGV